MILTWEIVAAFMVSGGAIAGGFWRIWGLIEQAKKDAVMRAEGAIALASTAREELAAHRLHVAETYTTKAGMAEQTSQIMKAIDGVSGKIDHLNGRIDGLMKPTASRSRTNN